MRYLRLSAEFQCYPTWLETDEGIDNIFPGELSISAELVAALDDWRERWDAIYDMDDPMNSGFSSEEEKQRFREDGEDLVTRLQAELGPDWAVHRRAPKGY